MIARMVHSPETQHRIAERISNYESVVTSLVVKQEFKRRLLKEAQYLLNQLNSKGSYKKVLRHIMDVLPHQQQRKRNICLETMVMIFESTDDTANDAELTERAISYMRSLLRYGLSDFESGVDRIIWDSGCACSHLPIEEKSPYRLYEFGTDKCSRTGNCSEFRAAKGWVREVKVGKNEEGG